MLFHINKDGKKDIDEKVECDFVDDFCVSAPYGWIGAMEIMEAYQRGEKWVTIEDGVLIARPIPRQPGPEIRECVKLARRALRRHGHHHFYADALRLAALEISGVMDPRDAQDLVSIMARTMKPGRLT